MGRGFHCSPCVVALGLTLGLAGGLGAAQAQSHSPLADAAKAQETGVVRALLVEGAEVDRPQGDGATALHWASYWDDLETATLLVTAGATVGAVNDLGVTPLWLACNNGSATMVEVLLDAGADANATLPSGETVLMTAARTGSVGAVRLLLEGGANVNAREGSQGQTALMWAVAQQHAAIVRVLLERGARVDARSHAYPQMISSSGNADPSGVYEITQGGYTPLLFAARHGDLESAKLLISAGADVNDAAPVGTSALVVAAHGGHGELAAFLLEQGADPNAADAGYSALHVAVLRADLDAVTALIAHGGDPNARVLRGTPARRVSADWRLGHDMIGATPFWLAARFREPEIMRVLVDGGADPLISKGQTTALMAALQGGTGRGRFGVPGLDREAERSRLVAAVGLALDAGVDANAADERGDTSLHIAATRRFDDLIALLVQRGAALDVRNGEGQTPLGLAMAGPQGTAALYNPRGGSASTAALLRELGATDSGGR